MYGREISSFVTESADIFLRVAKQGDGRIASELINWLAEITFEVRAFRRYIKTLPHCEDIFSRTKIETTKVDGLCRVLVRYSSAKKDSYDTL